MKNTFGLKPNGYLNSARWLKPTAIYNSINPLAKANGNGQMTAMNIFKKVNNYLPLIFILF
ncbi:MAG: hypothetical protein Q8910_18125 [Bacteroidota bacterium]|nr:hypothetical protein [Bacteroidota bacterium]